MDSVVYSRVMACSEGGGKGIPSDVRDDVSCVKEFLWFLCFLSEESERGFCSFTTDLLLFFFPSEQCLEAFSTILDDESFSTQTSHWREADANGAYYNLISSGSCSNPKNRREMCAGLLYFDFLPRNMNIRFFGICLCVL